jgi:hypothetical protein
MEAKGIHERYAAQVGAETIATRYALRGIINWLRRVKPLTVLEVGPGIGTTTAAIQSGMSGTGYRHVLIEDNEWCIARLAENVGNLGELELHRSRPNSLGSFDFVLIDGLASDEVGVRNNEEAAIERSSSYFRDLAPRALVMFEGSRIAQQEVFRSMCAEPFAHANFRPLLRSRGYHVYQLNPTIPERLRFTIVDTWSQLSDVPRRALRKIFVKVIGHTRHVPSLD